MSRGAGVRGELAKAPAAVATSLTENAAWFHEAPTRPHHAATLPAEASLSTSGTVSVDTKVGPEPMCDAVTDRLSDPGRWFQSVSPPPPPLPQPATELPPEQVQRRRLGGTLVMLSMALSLLILFTATIARVRAAMGAEKSRAIASAPAPSVTKPQMGGVHSGSAEARKGLLH